MFRQHFFGEPPARAAYRDLIRRVFDLDLPDLAASRGPRWVPFGYFDEAGRCIANVEAAMLSMVCDGHDATATALRLVATDPAWRGQGLFRDLMERALVWSATMSDGPCLLYTADPNIYSRYGFRPLPQHAFVGAVRPVAAGHGARIIDVARSEDRRLVEHLMATRTAVSNHCAIVAAPSLFMSRVAGADDLTISYDAAHGMLVVHERDDDCVTLVDVVAAVIPPLDVVLRAAGGCPTGRLKSLFPPDRLDWQAQAVPEETGLMSKGTLAPAMTRPFMLPPTTEF